MTVVTQPKVISEKVHCKEYIMHFCNWLLNPLTYSGHGLTLQHLRYNSECDVYEELEPIDRNLQYDFNYQQINQLTREVTVLPVRAWNIHYDSVD